jgi:hypothetical protein
MIVKLDDRRRGQFPQSARPGDVFELEATETGFVLHRLTRVKARAGRRKGISAEAWTALGGIVDASKLRQTLLETRESEL